MATMIRGRGQANLGNRSEGVRSLHITSDAKELESFSRQQASKQACPPHVALAHPCTPGPYPAQPCPCPHPCSCPSVCNTPLLHYNTHTAPPQGYLKERGLPYYRRME